MSANKTVTRVQKCLLEVLIIEVIRFFKNTLLKF